MSKAPGRGDAAFSLMLVGGLFAAVLGFVLLSRAWQRIEPSVVLSCDIYKAAKGPKARVELANGATVHLDGEDVDGAELCLPRGTKLEKRRWEFGYRADGALQGWDLWWPVGFMITFLLVFAAGARRIKKPGILPRAVAERHED